MTFTGRPRLARRSAPRAAPLQCGPAQYVMKKRVSWPLRHLRRDLAVWQIDGRWHMAFGEKSRVAHV